MPISAAVERTAASPKAPPRNRRGPIRRLLGWVRSLVASEKPEDAAAPAADRSLQLVPPSSSRASSGSPSLAVAEDEVREGVQQEQEQAADGSDASSEDGDGGALRLLQLLIAMAQVQQRGALELDKVTVDPVPAAEWRKVEVAAEAPMCPVCRDELACSGEDGEGASSDIVRMRCCRQHYHLTCLTDMCTAQGSSIGLLGARRVGGPCPTCRQAYALPQDPSRAVDASAEGGDA